VFYVARRARAADVTKNMKFCLSRLYQFTENMTMKLLFFAAFAATLAVAGPSVATSPADTTSLLSAAHKKVSTKPGAIANLRYYRSPDQTRLVFDLARPVKYTQHRLSHPNQVVIQLMDTVLSSTAKRKVEGHGLPDEVDIKQTESRRVQVTLNLDEATGLKLHTLSNPYRLILDYIPKKVEAPAAPPKITLPPISRQITEAQRQARLDIETIVIDPGHGGKDPGAMGHGGLTEKDIVLDIGLRLRALLQDRLGKKVLMTRSTNTFIELDDRAKFANEHKADLFVSIHMNSHPKRNVRGMEMYHFGIASDRRAMEVAARENGDSIDHARDFLDQIKADLALSKRIEESQNLAWETKLAVMNLMSSSYDLVDHGVKTAPFYVLRYTAMPSILAELSFISNSSDEKRLHSAAYRQKLAEGLYEGIRNYLNSVQVAFAQ
jgi:N-acetylmuramoyl-L-alanine amidase